MNELLCLKWNNHTSAFMKKVTVLQEKELYSDATIVCHGKHYPVHRMILSTCSDYFEEIFEKIQCRHPFIIVKDIKPFELKALLCYMYKGEVNILQDALAGLIKAAESLKVKGLAVPDDIENYSCSKVSNTKEIKVESKVIHNQENLLKDNIISSSDNLSLQSNEPFIAHFLENDKEKLPFIKTENDVGLLNSDEVPSDQMESNYSLLSEEKNLLDNFNNFSSGSQNAPQCSSWESFLPNFARAPSIEGFHDEIVRMCLVNPMASSPSDNCSEQQLTLDTSLKCSDCSFKAKHLSAMKKHVDTNHKGKKEIKKKMKCKHCNFEATQKQTMALHNRKHTVDKPYRCPVCPYRCAKKWNMVIHTRIHTGEKPHSCPHCPFASAYSNILNKHIDQKHKNINVL